ncbi:argininosuccinate lyase [Cyclobacteriaceae bacterium]|nr:argininosuccinate lyase [Cyclobacteriaceae bacterium]
MASKLWQKSYSTEQRIEEFTVGNDAQLDHELAPFDVQGSLAHIEMLESIDLLEKDELTVLQKELKNIYKEILAGDFTIEDGVEDIHSQVEMLLTQRLGDVGKKIHSGRSRNDQVLVDLKLYTRAQLKETVIQTKNLFEKLLELSEKYKDCYIPGYTHLQVAMPSSFGLWFGAYAESLADDMHMLLAAYKVANKNPLGSAAGYGSSFPLNRTMTTDLLGFESLNYNVVYAQMSRGKTEKLVSMALASVAGTLSRMAMDVCLYMNQNFGFMTFPKELTTGSSIMPHKKNPDVFEIMRGKCNRLASLPNEITLLTTNLPSGYHREMQLIKEGFFPAFNTINECLDMAGFMFDNVIINKDILQDDKYKFVFSVENVNDLVLKGTPFRDAYKIVGEQIEDGSYEPLREFHHTHEGSIGNLSNDAIAHEMNNIFQQFKFDKTQQSIEQLIKN